MTGALGTEDRYVRTLGGNGLANSGEENNIASLVRYAECIMNSKQSDYGVPINEQISKLFEFSDTLSLQEVSNEEVRRGVSEETSGVEDYSNQKDARNSKRKAVSTDIPALLDGAVSGIVGMIWQTQPEVRFFMKDVSQATAATDVSLRLLRDNVRSRLYLSNSRSVVIRATKNLFLYGGSAWRLNGGRVVVPSSESLVWDGGAVGSTDSFVSWTERLTATEIQDLIGAEAYADVSASSLINITSQEDVEVWGARFFRIGAGYKDKVNLGNGVKAGADGSSSFLALPKSYFSDMGVDGGGKTKITDATGGYRLFDVTGKIGFTSLAPYGTSPCAHLLPSAELYRDMFATVQERITPLMIRFVVSGMSPESIKNAVLIAGSRDSNVKLLDGEHIGTLIPLFEGMAALSNNLRIGLGDTFAPNEDDANRPSRPARRTEYALLIVPHIASSVGKKLIDDAVSQEIKEGAGRYEGISQKDVKWRLESLIDQEFQQIEVGRFERVIQMLASLGVDPLPFIPAYAAALKINIRGDIGSTLRKAKEKRQAQELAQQQQQQQALARQQGA